MTTPEIDPDGYENIKADLVMSDEEFAQNLRHNIGLAHTFVSNNKLKGMVPVMYVYCAKLRDTSMTPPWSLDKQLHTIFMADWSPATYRGRAGAEGYKFSQDRNLVRAVYYASEAWYSTEKVKDIKDRKYKQPSDDPNRQEVIQVMGMTPDGRCNMAKFSVRRGHKDIMLVNGEIEYYDYGTPDQQLTSGLLYYFYKEYSRGMASVLEKITAEFN